MDLKTEGVTFSSTASSNTWRDSSESPVIFSRVLFALCDTPCVIRLVWYALCDTPCVIQDQKAQREEKQPHSDSLRITSTAPRSTASLSHCTVPQRAWVACVQGLPWTPWSLWRPEGLLDPIRHWIPEAATISMSSEQGHLGLLFFLW